MPLRVISLVYFRHLADRGHLGADRLIQRILKRLPGSERDDIAPERLDIVRARIESVLRARRQGFDLFVHPDVSERFFRSAKSRSESSAELRRTENDAVIRNKIRSHGTVLGWNDYNAGPRDGGPIPDDQLARRDADVDPRERFLQRQRAQQIPQQFEICPVYIVMIFACSIDARRFSASSCSFSRVTRSLYGRLSMLPLIKAPARCAR